MKISFRAISDVYMLQNMSGTDINLPSGQFFSQSYNKYIERVVI